MPNSLVILRMLKKLNIGDVCWHDCKGSSRCLRWIVWPMRTLAGLLLQTLWHFMARQALSGCRAAGSSNSKDINIGRRPILRSAFRRPSTAQARQADPPYLVASQPLHVILCARGGGGMDVHKAPLVSSAFTLRMRCSQAVSRMMSPCPSSGALKLQDLLTGRNVGSFTPSGFVNIGKPT